MEKKEIQEQPKDKKALLTEKVIGQFTQNEINVLRSTLAADASPEQFNLFINTAVASGLNPFLNHIYPIVYSGKLSIQIAVEGIIHLARKKDGFLGYDSQVICEHDEYVIEANEGKWAVKKHVIKFPRGKVIAAYAIARRENFPDVVITMDRSEIEGFTKGRNSKMWNDYQVDMFKKHVLKRALKQQFGIEIDEGEVIAGSELDQVQHQPQERKEITPNEPQQDNVGKMHQEIIQKLEKYNYSFDFVENLAKEQFEGLEMDELNAQELAGLSRLIDLRHNQEQHKPQETKPDKPQETKEEKPSVMDEDLEQMGMLFDE